MRIFLATIFIAACCTAILTIFWHQEIKFTLPTPKPEKLEQVAIGEQVELDLIKDTLKPTFIHYYNYDCPCSRFNIKEFKRMLYEFQDSVNFIVIVQAGDDDQAADELFKEAYDLNIRTVHDKNGAYANQLGIYSTPQAVIIKNNQVYYRGNYNKARFCTSRNTKFAEMALRDALDNKETPWMPLLATTAYGCELPSNGNTTTTHLFNF